MGGGYGGVGGSEEAGGGGWEPSDQNWGKPGQVRCNRSPKTGPIGPYRAKNNYAIFCFPHFLCIL